MNRILELQLMQLELAGTNETNETNYSSCSNRGCSIANGDGYDEPA